MAFNVPINSIKPIATPPDWVRPSDWIAITDTANEVQFLVADVSAKAFAITTTFIKNSGTNIYIDWGDGVTDTISTATSVTTNHVYSTGGTPCSRGYNTFKIRIYGDATCQITNARHIPNFAVTGGSPFYSIGLLEAYFGDNACNTTAFSAFYFTSNGTTVGNGTFNYLEYVKLPATVAWTNQIAGMFSSCINLYKVIMPTSASALTDVNACFSSCTNLLDISLPSNATAIITLGNFFNGCTNLRTVSLPTSLNSCTSFGSTFSGCYSLKNVTLPSINLVTNLSSAFLNCISLQWAKITSMPSPVFPSSTVNISNAFQGCYNLQTVYFPSTCSSNAIYTSGSLFNSCSSLKNVIFPTNFNASGIQNSFGSCFSLTNVTFQSAMPNLTTMIGTFTGCYLLNSVTLPSTVSVSGIDLANAFQNCISLPSITIPSGWLINNLSFAFSGCNNITSITLPNNAQNSCTTMQQMAQNCYKLQTIVMPTSLNLVSSLATTFSNCYELTSVTLPATMNAVTTALVTFQNCYSLTSVTMPTSMSACTTFSQTFSNCYSLTNLLMPSTISSTVLTTYQSLVSGCSNLKTLTLPTTQSSALIATSLMIYGCGNLITINNTDKLGSLTATPLVVSNFSIAGAVYTNALTSLSFNHPISAFAFNGTSTTTNFCKLNSLRFLNASTGQWTGTSPHINISFCDLSTAALNILFADIAAQGVVTAKTINITSCTGAAGLTAADRLVLTSRGWTITG